jgi:septum formation protein
MRVQSHKRSLILASTSTYRKLLLDRLGLDFETRSPDVDETARNGEAAGELVTRLAREKARSVAVKHPGSIVIGSDQVAVCDGAIIGKPGDAAGARAQLRAFSGRSVQFLTAVCVIEEASDFLYEITVPTEVRFRTLTADEIRRYVEHDEPFDCAGSFKSEALGIGLLSALTSDDPTAIVGLPLIAVSDALRRAGLPVP